MLAAMGSTGFAPAEHAAGDDRHHRCVDDASGGAEVVSLDHARAERTSTSTSTPEGLSKAVDVDVDPAPAWDPRPPSQSEVEAFGRRFPGWLAGSLRVVYEPASKLPRIVFLEVAAIVEEADVRGASTNPIGLLVSLLRGELAARFGALVAQADTGKAEAVAAQFDYRASSPSAQLRAEPERWVRTMAPRLMSTDVERYLAEHVAAADERARLQALAETLHAADLGVAS